MPASGSFKKLSPAQITLFCTQVSLFLHAGVTLVEGLNMLESDVEHGNFQGVVHALSAAVSDRQPFGDAMKNTGAFPAYLVRMVGIGEVSGNLEEILVSMARFYEREQALKQRVRSAVTYPVLLILMMTAIVFLLIVQVLPMFDDLLKSLGGELPGIVQGLMSFGRFVGNNIFIIVGIIAIIFIVIKLMQKSEAGGRFWDGMKANLPGLRGMYRKIVAERFSIAMTFLLRAGIDIELALELVRDILGNRFMAGKIEECRTKIGEGMSIYDALYASGIFPRLFTRMLGIGFKTGDLDGMMERLAEIYEQEVDTSLARVTGSIEPIFVAILSIVVGIILISVMLPLIRIMSSIG